MVQQGGEAGTAGLPRWKARLAGGRVVPCSCALVHSAGHARRSPLSFLAPRPRIPSLHRSKHPGAIHLPRDAGEAVADCPRTPPKDRAFSSLSSVLPKHTPLGRQSRQHTVPKRPPLLTINTDDHEQVDDRKRANEAHGASKAFEASAHHPITTTCASSWSTWQSKTSGSRI